MLTEQRYQIILDLLKEKKSVTATELKEILDTSESTVKSRFCKQLKLRSLHISRERILLHFIKPESLSRYLAERLR